ncbi:MAG: phosphate signaling complex PhoU family protein [Thermoproteus sp.]
MRRLLDLAEAQIAELLRKAAEIATGALDVAAECFGGVCQPERARAAASEVRRIHEHIAELALEAIARYSPVAVDLRYLRGAMFASYDLYRVARYGYDVADIASRLGSGCSSEKVREISRVVRRMVAESVEMLLSHRSDKLDEIVRLDDEIVDKSYMDSVARLMERREKCDVVEAMALRLLERASDHAVYIARQANFVATGELYL